MAFKLSMRDGAPVSVGRSGVFKSASALAVAPGALIGLGDNGKLVSYDPTASGATAPYGVVASSHTDGTAQAGEEIVVMEITPELYLEAPVAGTDAQIAALVEGAKCGLSTEGVNAAASALDFCRIVALNGAKTAGDRVVIRFE